MANHKSAEKRDRQNRKRRIRNRNVRSRIRTLVRKVEDALSAKDGEAATKHLPVALRALDQSVSKGVLHKNKAARNKSSLARKVNRLSAGA